MATTAFQKIYTKINQITKATCSLKATDVGYDELATIDGKALKYIIRKGTPMHDAMTKNGLANITDDVLKELAERFLLPKLDSTM